MTAFLAALVPEADVVVGSLRERWDPAVRRGLGAHVTIRYPFLPLEQLGPDDLGRLGAAVASVPAFRYALARVSSFRTTVFLAPEPAAPFLAVRVAVEAALGARLPADPHPAHVPHLSVARHVRLEQPSVVAATEEALRASPVTATCKEVALLERQDGPWVVRLRFPLRMP